DLPPRWKTLLARGRKHRCPPVENRSRTPLVESRPCSPLRFPYYDEDRSTVRARPIRVSLAASAALFAAAVVVPAAFLPAVAVASTATTWSAVNPIDHHAPLGAGEPIAVASCPTASLCVGAGYGDIATTTDPKALHGAASGWQVVDVDG